METKKFTPYSKIRKSAFFRAAKKVCEILQKSGFEAYFVGGCVRDLILLPNKLPKDIDIATSALPENIKLLFPNSRFVVEAFGVCLVQIGEFSFEVATFRVDGEYVGKRRPKSITQGNFIEDSCRRDFTMNALYYNPCKKIIKDIHGGIKDIKIKSIRCVGLASQRIDEDALRILRALRFSANLKFNFEKSTQEALIQFSPHLKLIAKERILLEFSKVRNMNVVVNFIFNYLNLNIFFIHSECFQKIKLSFLVAPLSSRGSTAGSIQSKTVFLNFLLHISLYYEIKVCQELFADLDTWPLTKQDSVLCKLYLNLFIFEDFSLQKKLNQEEMQFLLFLQIKKMFKIQSTSYQVILKNIVVHMKEVKLISFIKQCLEEEMSFSNEGVSNKIVDSMKKLDVPEYYTQLFIDYFLYKLFVNNGADNIENFVAENLSFIERIKQIHFLS